MFKKQCFDIHKEYLTSPLESSCVNISLDLICSVRTVISLFEYQHSYAGLCYGVWGHGPSALNLFIKRGDFRRENPWSCSVIVAHGTRGTESALHAASLAPSALFSSHSGWFTFIRGVKILIAEDWFYRQQGMPPPCCSGFACWLSIFLSAFTHEQTFT